MSRHKNRQHAQRQTTESGALRAAYDENKHKRGSGGRFASKPGASQPATPARRGGAVTQAHALFDKMSGKPRADVLAAAQAAGINRNTASTQFYHWQRARAAAALRPAAAQPTREELQDAAARALGVPKRPASAPAHKSPEAARQARNAETVARMRQGSPTPAPAPPRGAAQAQTRVTNLDQGYHTGTDGKLYFATRRGQLYNTGKNGQQLIPVTADVKSAKFYGDGHTVGESVALHNAYLAKQSKPAATPAANRFAMQPGERPVAALHRIANEMHDRPRADVIATAVAAGVNRSTASVQYSQWLRNRGAGPATGRAPVATATPAARTPARPAPTAAEAGAIINRMRPPTAAAPKPKAADRELIQDGSVHKPAPGTPERALHDKLHRAASAFKGAVFNAKYNPDGKLYKFEVNRGQYYGSGDNDVTIVRTFTGDTVDHEFFRVGNGDRGTGAAKSFLAESVEAYQKSGFSKVKVHANIDVGGYAWLRYGFKPNAASTKGLQNALNSALRHHDRIKEALGPDGVAHVQKLSNAGKFDEIAKITTPLRRQDGSYVPLGKGLFLGSDWHGHLPLKNKSAMDTFYKYAGADK